jgi:putative transposase
MPDDPRKHNRRSIRLKGYDYTTPGGYFVTVSAHHGTPAFGQIAGDSVQLTRLGAILQNFKSISTRKAHKLPDFVSTVLWQRNYYEHIIRDENELAQIRLYIRENPRRWLSSSPSSW